MVYLAGSLRGTRVRKVAEALRANRIDVFDDWHAAGPQADDIWQAYEMERGRTYREALLGAHATDVFQFDRANLDRSTHGVLVMPAGKSAHIELGYLIGQGKPGYILLEQEPERWDIMYRFATKVFYDIPDLVQEIVR